MANWNDLELAQRIRSGDREAEDEIVRRFHDRIARKVCYFLEQNREGAKDLIQDTMMEVLRSLREGKFDAARGTQLGDYISGIAGNMMQQHFRKQKRERKVTDELANEIQSGIMEEAEIEREERRQELRKKLRRLEPKYQEVLYLRYFEGLSVQEIAQRLNLPPRRVSERINYATKLLQKEFKKAEIFSIFPVVFLNIV